LAKELASAASFAETPPKGVLKVLLIVTEGSVVRAVVVMK
jgi:hypothetical protein